MSDQITIEQLRVAVYGDGPDFAIDQSLLVSRDAPELVTVLMAVNDDGVGKSLHREEVAHLGITDDELFAYGVANSQQEMSVIQALPPQFPGMFAVAGETFGVSGVFLSLESRQEMFGANGTLVAYCDKKLILCQRLDDADELDLGPILHADCTFRKTDPSRIDTRLWWRGHGVWDVMDVKLNDDGALEVRPGRHFAKIFYPDI